MFCKGQNLITLAKIGLPTITGAARAYHHSGKLRGYRSCN